MHYIRECFFSIALKVSMKDELTHVYWMNLERSVPCFEYVRGSKAPLNVQSFTV